MEEQKRNDFIADLEQEDVAIVMAAGNNPEKRLKDNPQALGTDDNGVITVGAVWSDGTLWGNSTAQGTGAGSLTVFAQGVEVKTWAPNTGVPGTTNGVKLFNGTSFAAPAVGSSQQLIAADLALNLSF